MAFALDPEENEIRVVHELVAFSGKDVLEVGSGDGRLTWRYADHAASVLALDPDPKRIDLALKSRPDPLRLKVTFEVADVTTFDLPEEAFDVALFSWSL